MASIPARHINPPADLLGRANAILTGTSRRHHVPEFAGCLSLKSVVTGSADWQVGKHRFVVREGCFLVLNDGQPYSLDIHSVRPTTTFCLFFARGFVEDIWRASSLSTDALLDTPQDACPNNRVRFFERLEPANTPVYAELVRLRQSVKDVVEPGAWEERFLAVGVRLVQAQHAVLRAAAKLPALRVSTQAELCRRLLRGRDLLLSCWAKPPSLQELAAEACLSPYHFHRSFAAFFGRTPHQMLTDHRLERIAAQLRQSECSILELCLDAGFQSPSSFSSLFLRRYGQSPSTYRREHRANSRKFARSEKKASGQAS